MNIGRADKKPISSRTSPRRLALEALGSRVVLSAGGWNDGVADFDAREAMVADAVYARPQEVSFLQSGIETDTFGKVSGGSWTAPSAGWHDQGLERSFASPDDGMGGSLSLRGLSTEYGVAPAITTLSAPYGMSVVIVPNVTWTLVITAPSFPTEVQMKAHDYDAPPRGWDPGPAPEPYHSLAGASDHGIAPAAINSLRLGGGPSDEPGSDSRLGSVQVSLAHHVSGSESQPGGGWLATAPSTTSTIAPVQSLPPSKLALVPDRLESFLADPEGGLIDLESPTLPRSKRLLGDNLLDEEVAANELRKLLDQVWSGWDRVRDALGEMDRATQIKDEVPEPNDAVAAMPDGAANSIMADAEGGMIELVVPESMVTGQGALGYSPAHLVQAPAGGGEKVRMDAGVSLYQSFELASAPDATPAASAASAKSADAESASDKNAKAKESSEDARRPSAALIGTGMMLSVPVSMLRNRKEEEMESGRRNGLLNVERIA